MNYYSIIKRIYTICNIPISIVDNEGTTTFHLPETEFYIMPPKAAKFYIQSYKEKHYKDYFPSMTSIPDNVYVGVFRLDEDNYVIIGPAVKGRVRLDELVTLSNNYINDDDLGIIYRIIQQSVHTDPFHFASFLSLIIQAIFKESIEPLKIIDENFPITELIEEPYKIEKESKEIIINQILFFEEQILSAVKSGNTIALEKIFKDFSLSSIQNASDQVLRKEYFFVPLLTLICRTAINEGAPKVECFMKYEQYTEGIAPENNSSIHFQILKKAAVEYCELVKQTNNKNLRRDICDLCDEYIEEHLSEKITATDLSKYCNIDKSIIFKVIKTNYNMTLTEYIQKERMRHAEVLLLSSRYTIGQVAIKLGFSSQAYFTKVFNKYYHMTPKQFKEVNMRN